MADQLIMTMDWYPMMGWGRDAPVYWFFPFMWLWMAGYWLVFLVFAYLVYRDAQSRGMNALPWAIAVALPWIGLLFLIAYLIVRDEKIGGNGIKRRAEEILDERYAKGEITRDEYQQMRRDLTGDEKSNL